jgi:hypothetical protein
MLNLSVVTRVKRGADTADIIVGVLQCSLVGAVLYRGATPRRARGPTTGVRTAAAEPPTTPPHVCAHKESRL